MEYLFGMLCIGGIAGSVLAFWFAAKASKKKDEARANAPALLDQLFNGDAVVTYTAGFAALDETGVHAGALELGLRSGAGLRPKKAEAKEGHRHKCHHDSQRAPI